MKFKQSKNVFLLAITTCLSIFSNIAISDDTSEYSVNAEEIMNLSREYQRGLKNSMSTVTMTIKTRDSQIVRIMEQYILESEDAGNKTINVFSQPADVKGVSVLTHTARDGNDQQWLFLPSINRTKRISSSNRDNSFVGSDFAFEDLSSLELSKYEFDKASAVEIVGKKLIKVAYRPKYNGSGYSYIETYLDDSNYQPKFNRYFNSRGEHSKTLYFSDYVSYSETGAWRPHVLKMEDHIKNSETEIVFEEFTTDSINKNSFRPSSFNRVQ